MTAQHILLMGFGYLARRVAGLLGQRPVVMTRRADVCEAWRDDGGRAWCFDLDVDGPVFPASDFRDIFYSVPPPASGREDPRMGRFLQALTRSGGAPGRIVLISTTGVYGDCQGAWVDERRPLAPCADRAYRRVDAERRLQDWCRSHDCEYVILRVPGIYAPDRLPEARIRSGKPVLCPEHAPWSNRIHAHDLARACVAALTVPDAANRIFNISDGHPSTMTDYFWHVADYLGLARPPCIDPSRATEELSEGMRSYLAESKRIDNRLMREVLGIQPQYPDLAAGLPLAEGS